MILEFIGNVPRENFVRVGVNGNNLVDDLVFILGRKQGKNDLYEFTPKIKITTPERNFAEYSGDDLTVEKIEERDTIKITYVLPEIVTSQGNVDMQIAFEKTVENGVMKWQTLPINVTFPEAINESDSLIKAYPNIVKELIEKNESTSKLVQDNQTLLAELFKGIITEEEVKEIVATEIKGKVDKIIDENARLGTITVTEKDGTQKAYRVDNQSTSSTIVLRDAANNFYVGSPIYDTHVTNKKYVDDATAPIADNSNKIADHETRIDNLESTLCEFPKDTETAYEKDVPVGVGEKAVLSYIGGNTIKNFLDPSLFGKPVNEDGSFAVSFDNGDGGSSYINAKVTLPSGTYYLKGGYDVIETDNDLNFIGFALDGDPYNYATTITLTETAEVEIYVTSDSVGVISANVYLMLSTDPAAEFLSFSEGEIYAPVTSIDSINQQLLDPSKLEIGYYDVENGELVDAQNFHSFRTPLKAGEYTINSDIRLRLVRRLEGDTVLNLVASTPFTFTVEKDCNFGFSFRVDDGIQDYVAHAKIMLNKGKEVLPYSDYDANFSRFSIPAEIQAINGYGKEGFLLNFEAKRTLYEDEVTDVSQYLKGYDKFRTVEVRGGGRLRFVNKHGLAVPTKITYAKAKE